MSAPRTGPGIVRVTDRKDRFLGQALFSPASEIRLRLLTTEEAPVDQAWWHRAIAAAAARRAGVAQEATAYRVVHAEGDALPSLIVDRYGDVIVAQLLSAGLEVVREDVLHGLERALAPTGILLRNDASVRRYERLPLEVTTARGSVPRLIRVREGQVEYLIDVHGGQKTGGFLDQRENRQTMEVLASGRGLDLFTYQGLFALHLAGRCTEVIAADTSQAALDAAHRNARLNGITNIQWIRVDAFDLLRALERRGERFDTIVLDPPAFAKQKRSLSGALRGYKEINLRALHLLSPGGTLFTASCSFHVDRATFFEMLTAAAADSGARMALARIVGQSSDHPELLTVPETGYLKGAVLRRLSA